MVLAPDEIVDHVLENVAYNGNVGKYTLDFSVFAVLIETRPFLFELIRFETAMRHIYLIIGYNFCPEPN